MRSGSRRILVLKNKGMGLNWLLLSVMSSVFENGLANYRVLRSWRSRLAVKRNLIALFAYGEPDRGQPLYALKCLHTAINLRRTLSIVSPWRSLGVGALMVKTPYSHPRTHKDRYKNFRLYTTYYHPSSFFAVKAPSLTSFPTVFASSACSFPY